MTNSSHSDSINYFSNQTTDAGQTISGASDKGKEYCSNLKYDGKALNDVEKIAWLEAENDQLNDLIRTMRMDNELLTDIISILKKSYHTALQKTQTPSYLDHW